MVKLLIFFSFLLLLSCDPKSSSSVSSSGNNSIDDSSVDMSKYDLKFTYDSTALKIKNYNGIYIFDSKKTVFPIDDTSSNFDYFYEIENMPEGIILSEEGSVIIKDPYKLSSIDFDIKIRVSKNKVVLTNMSVNFSTKVDFDSYSPGINQLLNESVQIYIPKLSFKNSLTVYHSRDKNLIDLAEIQNSTKLKELEVDNQDQYFELQGNFKDAVNYLYFVYTYNKGESYMIKKTKPFRLGHFFGFSKIDFNSKTSDLVFNKISPTGYTYKIYEINQEGFTNLSQSFNFENSFLASSAESKIQINYKNFHGYLLVSSNHSNNENVILSECSVLDQSYVVATNVGAKSADITFFPFYYGNVNEFNYKLYSHSTKPSTLAEAKAGTKIGEANKISSLLLSGLTQFSIEHISVVISSTDKNSEGEHFSTYSFIPGADLYWDVQAGMFATNQDRWVNLTDKGSKNDGIISDDGKDFSYDIKNKYFTNNNNTGNIVFDEITDINAIFIVANFTNNSSTFIGHNQSEQWNVDTSSYKFFANSVNSKIRNATFWKNRVKFKNKDYFIREEKVTSYGLLLDNGGNLNTGIKASQVREKENTATVWQGKFKN